MLWTRQIPAPPTVSRAVPTLPGVFTQKWDFGTLQYNSNQATGCNGPGIPAYQVNIPISNVFWDPPIVAGAPNVRGYNITVPAGPGVVEFWKKLLDAKIVFPIPQDMEGAELDGLESYYTIENNHVCLNKGVITDSDGMLYSNGECTDVRLPSILTDACGGMLCLPDSVYFLGDEDYGLKLLIRNCYLQLLDLIEKNRKQDGPAKRGCAITGTPGIGKTYFGLYLLFYIRYSYPDAIIVWQCNEKICYRFSPNGNMQKGNIDQFDKTLDNCNNFFLVDAQALTFSYKAYMILFTSPKTERFNKAVKWPGFTQYYMPIWEHDEITTLWALQYKNKKNNEGKEFTLELLGTLLEKWGPIPRSVLLKWNDKTYQQKYQTLINEANLESCINSIDKSGMPTDAISGGLVYLEVDPTFTNVVYRFASPRVSDKIIQEYESKTRNNVRDLITSSHEFPKIAGFQGNLFEDFAHLELKRGGTFRIRCLNNDNSEITEKCIENLECNWFMMLNEARKEYYNRPKSKTFASIDSFSLDNNALALYQITISTNHGIKIKGLNDLNHFLSWKNDMNEINLYFVMPSDIFEKFLPQKYKTAKDQNCQKIPKWINNITQYALEINVGSGQYDLKRSSDTMLGDNEIMLLFISHFNSWVEPYDNSKFILYGLNTKITKISKTADQSSSGVMSQNNDIPEITVSVVDVSDSVVENLNNKVGRAVTCDNVPNDNTNNKSSENKEKKLQAQDLNLVTQPCNSATSEASATNIPESSHSDSNEIISQDETGKIRKKTGVEHKKGEGLDKLKHEFSMEL
ncbi:15027_t:CDS:2 [Entrophospora sp. SA101]|nr:15027_t:CDS:2 [Entrophospora sp. SA101]